MLYKIHSIVYVLSSFFFISALVLAGSIFFLWHNTAIVDFSVLERFEYSQGTVVLDDEGKELCHFSADRRTAVAVAEIPAHLINAFVATEDRNFWTHSGLSWRGIIRSIMVNAYHRKMVQGASTITQQLVRLLFFDARKTWWRKIKEQVFASIVEKQYTKHQIMQMYLNNIYFGAGIYGVEAACWRFWNKPVSAISLDQAAVLAAIVKSPARYCPLFNLSAVLARRNTVLLLMYQQKMISKDEYANAKQMPLAINSVTDGTNCSLYVREYMRLQLEKMIGKERLYARGCVVQATINLAAQLKAEAVFMRHMQQLRNKLSPSVEGALLCIEGSTGAIKALVGGSDFKTSQFNRILAKRQLGSIFKPIIYAAAIAQGQFFTQTCVDEPVTLNLHGHAWSPNNYDNAFHGTMTLAYALMHSSNIVALKTLLSVGIERVVEFATKCNLSTVIKPYPSLALGCVDGTLVEAVGMFNIFAQHGTYCQPHSIVWIKDETGHKIWHYKETSQTVISSLITDQVARVLKLGFDRLRNRFSAQLPVEAIGKTGTTNDCRTCWFCGATPTYTTAVYIGLDNNASMGKDVYPASTAFPIWYEFNTLLAHSKTQFNWNPHLRECTVHQFSGLPCVSTSSQAINVLVP